MPIKISRKAVALAIIVLLSIDQVVKIIIKTSMTLNESITVLPNWFFIRFIENPGAAFGLELGGDYGKLLLSLFRIFAVFAIAWYIQSLAKKRAPNGVLIGFTLIISGALGNIIDSAFYGLFFSASTYGTVAQFLPEAGGYAGFLHGHVVDMLYFPIIDGTYPSWIPYIGGDEFTFFSPIFNIADSYITIGVIYLLLFQRKFFNDKPLDTYSKSFREVKTEEESTTSK